MLEVQRGEPGGAELAILLLRVLQDQQRHRVVDTRDALADAQRRRLAAVRAFGIRIGRGRCPGGGRLGHRRRIRPDPGSDNARRGATN